MQTLEEIRKARGVTKSACAKALNISLPTWDKYEKDPTQMRVLQMYQICNFLHCEFDNIFFTKNIN